MDNWTKQDEDFLYKLHQECNILIEAYRDEYLLKNHQLCHYRIPTIILSTSAGFLSVTNAGYIPKNLEKYVAMIVGIMNLITSMINIIENFKGISNKVNLSERLYHELLQLSNDISLTLSLSIEERNYKSGIEAVTKYYERYSSIVKDANILNIHYENFLELHKSKSEIELN